MGWPNLVQLFDSQHSHSYDGTEVRETWYIEPYDSKTAFIASMLGYVDPNSGVRRLPCKHFAYPWCMAMQCDSVPLDQRQLSYCGTTSLDISNAQLNLDAQVTRVKKATESFLPPVHNLVATDNVDTPGFVSQTNAAYSAGAFVVVTYQPAITAATPYKPSGQDPNMDFLNLRRTEKTRVNIINAGLRLISPAGLWYPDAGIAPEYKEVYQEINIERRMLKPTFDLEKVAQYANFVNKNAENFPNWFAPGVGASQFAPETLRFATFQDQFVEVPAVDQTGTPAGFCQWLNLTLTYERRLIWQPCVFSEGAVPIGGINPVTWNHVLAYPGTFSWLEGVITGHSAGLGWYYAKYSADSVGVDSFSYPRCPAAFPAGSTGILDPLTKNF